jgi:hypothetical protein
MATLGEQLAQNIEREKKAASDSEAAFALLQTEEARKNFRIVEGFFKEAREYFTRSIQAGAPVKKLYLQVGGARFSIGVNCHDAVADVLGIYQRTYQGPQSLSDPLRYSSLWQEFRQWAMSEGLEATWHDCYDGGGVDNWWQLRVAPRAQVLKR